MLPAAATAVSRHWSSRGRLRSSNLPLLRVTTSYQRQHCTPAAAMAANAIHPRAQAVLSFWFADDFASAPVDWFPEQSQSKWWGSSADAYIHENFAKDWETLVNGGHDDWQASPHNALAGIIVLDQFTRNMNRGSARTWQADPQASAWARKMLENKLDVGLPLVMRAFLAMPFMHSESLADQEECVRLMAALQAELKALPESSSSAALGGMLASFHKYGVMHRDVVAKWGRFPHRNEILGRPSTEAEVQGLADGSIAKF